MKVQRLIEKYKNYENDLDDIGARVACKHFLKDLEQLDEQEKVKIPQFMADWINHSRNIGRSLFGAMSMFEEKIENKKWMQWAENQELFAQAWIFGYEVEKEKRYQVKIKGEIEENLLVYGLGIERYFFATTYDSSKRGEHTRKQLEDAGFGWVFDCPGIEIEEVE